MTYRPGTYWDDDPPQDHRNNGERRARDRRYDHYFGPETEHYSLTHQHEDVPHYLPDANELDEERQHDRSRIHGGYTEYSSRETRCGEDNSNFDTRGEYVRDETYHLAANERGFNRLHDARIDPFIDDVVDDRTVVGIAINKADLLDVERAGRFPRVGQLVLRCTAAAAMFAIVVLMYTSLKPDVSAYEIVSMESYQGQQKPDWTFDPAKTVECDSLSDCFKQELSLSRVASEHDKPVFREIPASNQSLVEPQGEVSGDLPQTLIVSKQWSNIRTAPNMSGNIITSVDVGQQVEILGKIDNWYQIRVNDEALTEGFMHTNTLTETQ